MSKLRTNSAHVVSLVVVALAILASVGGIVVDGLYQDNLLVTSGFYGNDLVTLLVAVPLLAGSLIFAIRGSMRAQLVWLGMLVYMVYNFSFYLFGAAFNSLFLVYVALFALSIFALISGSIRLDAERINKKFWTGRPVKWICGYMLLVGLILGGLWISLSLNYIITGQVPDVIVAVDHPTNVIGALDLSLIVPLFLVGAIWLWQRQPRGYVLAAIANVNGSVYMLALAASTISAVQAGASEELSQVALWGFVGTGCLIATLFLFGIFGQLSYHLSSKRNIAFGE